MGTFSQLCENFYSLTSIPIRLYENNKMIYRCINENLIPDPLISCEKKILSFCGFAKIETNKFFQYFATINFGNYRLIVGPSGLFFHNSLQSNEFCIGLGVQTDKDTAYLSATELLPFVMFDKMVSFVIILAKTFADKTIAKSEIVFDGDFPIENIKNIEKTVLGYKIQNSFTCADSVQNSYDYEKKLIYLIKTGQTEKIIEMSKLMPDLKAGKLAQDVLRQYKNTAVCMTAVCARAAIDGGVDVKTVFGLSDLCIQKIEILSEPEKILQINLQLMLTYSELVKKTKSEFYDISPISHRCINYIKSHIYENIRLVNIAEHIKINKTYLCELFKSDTKKTIGNYILEEKINEAKSMLTLTEMTILEISNELAFSSQSHFQNVFKKIACTTPLAYRKNFN